MRLVLLILTLKISLLATGQNESIFKERVQFIIKEYESNFKNYFGEQIPWNPRTSHYVRPGLLDSLDEVYSYYDSVINYISDIYIKGDTSTVKSKITHLDNLLRLSLGNDFSREEFLNEQPPAIVYKSDYLEAKIVIGKLKSNIYLIVLGFSGRVRK